MTASLPDSAVLAWWGTSWLRGQVVSDQFLDAVLGDEDATHLMRPPTTDTQTPAEPIPLLEALARLRADGLDGLGLALPAEGDPVGLGGPASFNAAALEVGEAVVAGNTGLVPERVGRAVTWVAHPAARRQLPDVGEADRQLRAGIISAADALAALDVARWRPEVADELMNLRRVPVPESPPGVPPRCVELAGRALLATGIVDLALEDDGAAVTAYEIGMRRDALRPLEYAARRALVAACSPEVWPPG